MASSLIMVLHGAPSRLNHFLSKRSGPLREMLAVEWYLGLTSFGGPAVHFQIFQKKFVEELKWIDEQMYKEMFALCQSLPGPGSTKMLYAINLIRGGFTVGLLSFFVWSLPGAVAAYGLAVGISKVNDTLPAPVYALLSGLNSATVGIIALAAVQLSAKAITDKLSRLLVFFGGTAGMMYNALWYYPLLMVVGGLTTTIWDHRRLQQSFRRLKGFIFRRRQEVSGAEEEGMSDSTEMQNVPQPTVSSAQDTPGGSAAYRGAVQTERPNMPSADGTKDHTTAEESLERTLPSNLQLRVFSWILGVSVIALFFLTFIVIMVLRGTIHNLPLGFRVFANLYLAGTIIFGGGPVVIPLLREYVVSEGWVFPRDFLLGLAIIQAFPGPNFNFAVYLGALALSGSGVNAAAGAVIGYIAIFAPGLILHTGTMGIWKVMRQHRWVISALRGVNATAVGLIFAAVYRLWEIGYLSEGFKGGTSLGKDPWWVVITATSFVGGMWFSMKAPVAILTGGAMGMIWYGVVTG